MLDPVRLGDRITHIPLADHRGIHRLSFADIVIGSQHIAKDAARRLTAQARLSPKPSRRVTHDITLGLCQVGGTRRVPTLLRLCTAGLGVGNGLACGAGPVDDGNGRE